MYKGTIIYVGNFELPDKGASANRVVANGKIFTQLGYRVVFLGIRKDVLFDNICVTEFDANMYEEAYPRNAYQWMKHMCSVKNIKMLAEQYDDTCMIILYNAPFVLLQTAKRHFKKSKIKVVYDCTEWTTVTDGSIIKRFIKKIDERFVRQKAGSVADGMIVISHMMEKAYSMNKPLILLPPLVDLNDEIWNKKRKKESSDFEFCFAGMLDGNKDSLDKIVEAFAELKHANSILRIIGVSREEFLAYYPDLEKVVNKAVGDICFMGRLSHKETIQYVQNCDCYIFVRPSDLRNNAGFPTKFAEAYSCGCPMIASNVSDIGEYFTSGADGILLDCLTVCEIKQAMQTVMANDVDDMKCEKKRVFHYESYAERCEKWMEQLLD